MLGLKHEFWMSWQEYEHFPFPKRLVSFENFMLYHIVSIRVFRELSNRIRQVKSEEALMLEGWDKARFMFSHGDASKRNHAETTAEFRGS